MSVAARPLLTAAEVRDLLDRYGLAPNRRLGQHFVTDHNTLRRMVADAGVEPGDHVCEIGPGLGSLTLALREAGAHVTAVEVDAGMVRALTEVVGGDDGVTVVHADVRQVDLAALVARPASMVANLPYNIATAIALDALATGHFAALHLMVQREVGQRWTAARGDAAFGAVSVKVAAFADATISARISRRAFMPVPNVDSVTVALAPREWTADVARADVLGLVDRGFAQRRKRLRNSLASTVAPALADVAIAAVGLSPDVRAEQLDLSTWCELAVALREAGVAGWDETPVA